jgi:hypothetical protein
MMGKALVLAEDILFRSLRQDIAHDLETDNNY